MRLGEEDCCWWLRLQAKARLFLLLTFESRGVPLVIGWLALNRLIAAQGTVVEFCNVRIRIPCAYKSAEWVKDMRKRFRCASDSLHTRCLGSASTLLAAVLAGFC